MERQFQPNYPRLVPQETSIAQVSAYPESKPGGVLSVILFLSEKLQERGYEVNAYTPRQFRGGHPRQFTKPLGLGMRKYWFGSEVFWTFPDPIVRTHINPKILHAHEPGNNWAALPILWKRMGEDQINVATFHAVNENRRFLKVAYKGLVEAFNARQVIHALTVPSEATRRQTHEVFGLDSIVVPNGVDTNFFNPEGPKFEKYMDGKTNIGYLGRLEKRKNVDKLILTAAQLAKERDDFRLIIGGDGPEAGSLHRLVKNLNLENIVHFEGYIPQDLVPDYYRTLDIVASLPSGNEAQGIVGLEAGASGKAFFGGANEGYRTVIRNDWENGVLVNPNDIQECKSVLEILVCDKNVRKAMGEQGRKIAVDQYDWDVITSMHEEVYNLAAEVKHKQVTDGMYAVELAKRRKDRMQTHNLSRAAHLSTPRHFKKTMRRFPAKIKRRAKSILGLRPY